VSYLIDTNVVSEAVRPRPAAQVLRWLRSVPDSALHLSVLTVGELRSGIEKLGEGARKERLRVWLEQELPGWFGDRLLPVSAVVADRWGRLVGEAGRPVAAIDSLIAATAIVHGLRLVTRNARDFTFRGLDVINPWEVGGR
jgi:predicted nucleic acid-binding protein